MGRPWNYRAPVGGLDARSAPDPNLPAIRLPGGLVVRRVGERGGWVEVADPSGNRYWVDGGVLVGAPVSVSRRPSGWYAQLYRRTYGETGVPSRAAAPTGVWIGLALVVGGVFLPWIRPTGDWISAATSLDVPIRAMWAGDLATGTGSGIWNSVTGVSVGFCAIALAVAAALAALGRLPGWVKTGAAIAIALMPTAVAAQIARQASDANISFLSIVGPGMLLMLAGGAVLGLTKTRGGQR